MLVFVLLSKITWFLKFFGYFYLKDTHTHTHTHTHIHTPAHMRSIGVGAESGWTADSVPLTPSLSASGTLYGATLSPATPGCNPPGIVWGVGPGFAAMLTECAPLPPPQGNSELLVVLT